MDVEVKLDYLADKEYKSTNGADNVVNIDMYDKADKKAQSPMELLLSAFVACAAVDLVLMIKKRRKTVVDLKGKASGKRRDEHPRYYTDIHLHYDIYSPDLTDKEAERLVKLAVTDYCSVGGTVNGKANVTHSFKIINS